MEKILSFSLIRNPAHSPAMHLIGKMYVQVWLTLHTFIGDSRVKLETKK